MSRLLGSSVALGTCLVLAGCASENNTQSQELGQLEGMAVVPSGDFWMGCNEALDTQCEADEYPQRQVTLGAYAIDVYEISVRQYDACVAASACTEVTTTHDIWGNGPEPGWENHPESDYPLTGVTWQQAKEYCAWQDKRLPTEEEWEKAARGGCEIWGADCQTATPIYPWGNDKATCEYAVMNESEVSSGNYEAGHACGRLGALPVDSKATGVSPYGVYNLAGNAAEWVDGSYDAYEGAREGAAKPTGLGRAVIRGACFGSDAPLLRASNRLTRADSNASQVELGTITETDRAMGFRCAKTL